MNRQEKLLKLRAALKEGEESGLAQHFNRKGFLKNMKKKYYEKQIFSGDKTYSN